MRSRHWPLFGLRLVTPRLELRLPTSEDLDALADLAVEGVHDPGYMPFGVPWTDQPPQRLAPALLQYHWSAWGAWRPDDWRLELAVLRDDVVIGTQGVHGRDFALTREVATGSWLGRRFQGRGIGTEMRAAVLHLAFAGLGAVAAHSAAWADNAASLAVSRKLGYRPNGVERQKRRDEAALHQRLLLDRESWERHRTVPVEIYGLEPCLPLFGLQDDDGFPPVPSRTPT
ncbi:GNAT family N-acetyltransferase [Carbonactinospora thermoautotrophica]|uniref:GNAT family N-acetyltransferase n=1 Tax=Carbonactinospora thermoautotrophica TaxID=1469144 RepID=UPI00226D7834|nr:GNAT family N-acetyltransferase [Carbonactinospora thermoautotrophica]MCX9190716.1 GNAT family N-acetyltransferase [Carbonactinospora thermoautotrophica]